MKIVKNILALIGGIFVIIILLATILIVVKPYGINIIELIPALLTKNLTSSCDHPYLTTQQESILKSVGVNPKDIPTQITPALQECAISILGEKRANEIVSGNIPTISELLKLKNCLK